MAGNFYDKVAERFGGYSNTARHHHVYPQVDPEQVFTHKLLEHSGLDKRALDVGCADGRNTLALAQHFREIVAIDVSAGMLAIARKSQQDAKVHNVQFIEQDVHHLLLADASFDLVYSRRGPVNFPAFVRVLRADGWFVEIAIGEADAQGIKEVFGRGQMFGRWQEEPIRDSHRRALVAAGFEIVYADDFSYDEYYPSTQDLDLFLQGVPIFEDYDPAKDKQYLETYVDRNTSERGIHLTRHRVVIVGRRR